MIVATVERSVVFIATTLEEQGLLGAEYYAAHPLHSLEKTAGGVNMDAVNLFGPVPNMVAAGFGRTGILRLRLGHCREARRRLAQGRQDGFGLGLGGLDRGDVAGIGPEIPVAQLVRGE